MTDIQKEYCNEKGLIYIKPENTQIADYVNWLEEQIQALRIPNVVGRSEQLLEEQSNWLMANTSLEVEKIVDFKEYFK